VRSLISAANLTSELVLRGLAPEHPQRPNAESLSGDLHAVSTLMSTLRERAFQGLAAAEGHLEAELATAVHAATVLVSRRFSAVRIACEVPDGRSVRLAGGMVILERVLLNLIVNACEGDGVRAAENLWIRAWAEQRSVHVRIEDDGPGFPEDVLRAPALHVATTKRDGGGACVELVLPARDG
jgi:C4-dicarboxylate-specific signal transduction histidine kinase